MLNISSILKATRSSSNVERNNAEAEIAAQMQSQPQEFLVALLSKAGDEHCDVSDAQSALMVLKTNIVKHWSPGFEQYTGPPLTHECRQYVRESLLRLLPTANNLKIRTACASVISRISCMEYPDIWPDVVMQCVNMMSDNNNSLSILGGLELFRELLLETIREEDFMKYGQDVLTLLFNIALPKSTDGRRLTALQCFHESMTFLLMGDDDQMEHLEAMAKVFIPQWCQLFGQILLEPETLQEADVVAEILNSINEIDSGFPQILGPLLPDLFMVVTSVLGSYQLAHSGNRSLRASTDNGSQSESISSLSALLVTILQNKNARGLCMRNDETVIRFADILVELVILPPAIAEWWVEDPNAFVTAELGLGLVDFASRENAGILIELAKKPLILSHLLDILVQHQMDQSFAEAVLFLLANLISQVDVDGYVAAIGPNKLQSLLSALDYASNNDESENASDAYSILLIARKALTAAQIAKHGGNIIPHEIKVRLAMHPYKAPQSSFEVVRVAQAKSVTVTAFAFSSEFQAFQRDFLGLIASLIQDAEDDTPVFLTEALSAVLALNYDIVAQSEDAMNMIFALANKNTADVDLNAQILDVVGEVLEAIPAREVVGQIMRPIMATISKATESNYEFSGDLYFSLDLSTAIFEHQDIELMTGEREQMLQSFYSIITTTEDPQILQAASFAFAALVQNINSGVSSETAQNVLRVAAQLLNPDLSDSAALASGKLVIAIIEQFSSDLSQGILTELIEACAKRLITAKNALLMETLVLVFCELTIRNASAVVDLLVELNMLEPVMKQWIPTFEVVRGSEEIHKTVKALELLFDLHDSRLAETIMPDEPIRKPNQILTRRRAKNLQFTQVALPLKILKLLLKELAQAPKPPVENGQPAPMETKLKVDLSDNSDDEWDDELALNDDGDVLDFRIYGLISDWFKSISKDTRSIEWLNQLSADEQQFLISLS